MSRGINAKRASVGAPITRRHVLSGFHFEFNKGDRHLDAIGVTVSDGEVQTLFGDREFNAQDTEARIVFDNPYADFLKRGGDAYRIEHRFIELGSDVEIGEVRDQRCTSGGRCVVAVPQKPGHSLVLRGFELDFDSDDRHIKYLSLQPSNSGYLVNYSDQTPDDPYRVTIQYAYVPSAWRNYGDQPDEGWQTKQEPGAATYNLPKDKSSNFAIAGFEFVHPDSKTWNQTVGMTGHPLAKLDQDDGHIRELGVKTVNLEKNRWIEARARDDQYPAYYVRLWMTALDPKRIKPAP